MDLVVYDDSDQRYVPLLVAVVFALVVATLIGALAFFLGRRPAEAAAPLSGVSSPRAAVQADTGCAAALERAQEALELGARMEGALEEQTSVMDELLAKRLTSAQVLDRALPPLTAGAKDRQAFLAAVTVYEQARAACQK